MKRFFIILLCLFTITSCATEYDSKGRKGGYSEKQIDKNVWKVYFSANKHTNNERVSDFLRLRCAELTIHNGFYYFQISDSESNPKQVLSNSRNDFDTGELPSKSCVITCFKDKPGKGTSYDAAHIIKSIREKYNIP